jgi:hypothetical protein
MMKTYSPQQRTDRWMLLEGRASMRVRGRKLSLHIKLVPDGYRHDDQIEQNEQNFERIPITLAKPFGTIGKVAFF